MTKAAWWFRHNATHLIRRLVDPRWATVLAVAPDRAGLLSRAWPENLPRWAQGRGDLGQRMKRIFRDAPIGPILIIGGDIPEISKTHIARAFQKLKDHDAVIGPANDGGYWLIGLKRARPVPTKLFDGVRWSSPTALADTLITLSDLKVATIDTLKDVDTAADL